MSRRVLEITGARGVFAGARHELRVGERVTVGRSRFVDLSAVRTPMGLRIGRDKLERNPRFRRMSRRHFEISFESDQRIVISDLSRNGVHVDGRRIRKTAELEPESLAERGAVIAFGTGEELRLRVRAAALAPA